jgi:transcriptional regulator with XRE-family HTH domain
MSEGSNEIGRIIKQLRTRKAMSMGEVAEKIGVSVEHYEKIEAREIYPPLGLIVRLADCLGVSLGELFGDSADSPYCIVRRDAGTAISRFASSDGKSPGYSYEGLGQKKENRQMEPFLVTLTPDEVHKVEPNEHVGEEFIFVLKGQVKVTLLDHTDILNPGDSIYYDSTLPHIVQCAGEEEATILAVIYAKEEMIIF